MSKLSHYPEVSTITDEDLIPVSHPTQTEGIYETRNLKTIKIVDNLLDKIKGTLNSAGGHNSIFRGKYLGTEVTSAQYEAIAAGTFDDMFIGDYWTIGGVNYRIAHFDYWLHCGDTECTTHHIVVVPDANLYTAKMNDSNVTTGGYIGSKMYTDNLTSAKTTIQTAFGSSHILVHRQYFVNAVTNGKPSAGVWYDSSIDLMNERMVYGNPVFEPACDGSTVPALHTIDKSQLALFAIAPEFICNRADWWFRDVVSGAHFAHVSDRGHADYHSASDSRGVRPAFGIKAA